REAVGRAGLASRRPAAISRGRGGRLAQLVERLLYTQDVGGSSPSSPTSLRSLRGLWLGEPAPVLKAKRAKAAAPKPERRRRLGSVRTGLANPDRAGSRARHLRKRLAARV